MWVMSVEYARVVGHAFIALARSFFARGLSVTTTVRAALGLLRSTLPHVSEAARGLLEDAGLRRAVATPGTGASARTASA
jgi:hypothetical protein